VLQKKASDEKIVQNVFKKGDAYFRTGDLLSKDRCGFIHFEDRLGDSA
jgi:fatty-acyl-CoA synthase